MVEATRKIDEIETIVDKEIGSQFPTFERNQIKDYWAKIIKSIEDQKIKKKRRHHNIYSESTENGTNFHKKKKDIQPSYDSEEDTKTSDNNIYTIKPPSELIENSTNFHKKKKVIQPSYDSEEKDTETSANIIYTIKHPSELPEIDSNNRERPNSEESHIDPPQCNTTTSNYTLSKTPGITTSYIKKHVVLHCKPTRYEKDQSWLKAIVSALENLGKKSIIKEILNEINEKKLKNYSTSKPVASIRNIAENDIDKYPGATILCRTKSVSGKTVYGLTKWD